jgi:hypothetical protein
MPPEIPPTTSEHAATAVTSTTATLTDTASTVRRAPRARPHTVNVAVSARSAQRTHTGDKALSGSQSNPSVNSPALQSLASMPADAPFLVDAAHLLRIPFWVSNTRFALLELTPACTAGEIAKVLLGGVGWNWTD